MPKLVVRGKESPKVCKTPTEVGPSIEGGGRAVAQRAFSRGRARSVGGREANQAARGLISAFPQATPGWVHHPFLTSGLASMTEASPRGSKRELTGAVVIAGGGFAGWYTSPGPGRTTPPPASC